MARQQGILKLHNLLPYVIHTTIFPFRRKLSSVFGAESHYSFDREITVFAIFTGLV